MVAQSLLLKSWSKSTHTMNFCRVWVEELGFSWFKRFDAWVQGIHKQERKCHSVERSPQMIRLKTWLIDTDQCNVAYLQYSLFLFHRPLSWGTFTYYIGSHIIWALHLLIIQTPTWAPVPSDTPLNSLWVAVAKIELFRGLLLINAARRVIVMHLMWWWQLLLRYFGFPSFLHIGKIDYSGWDVLLLWNLQYPRRNYSSDMFSLPQWAWIRIDWATLTPRTGLGPNQPVILGRFPQ